MARIQACNGPDLSIHLDSAKSFLPGQRITGYISRTSPWVGTETNISISFHGRCSTEFISRDSPCRSSLDLFGQNGFQIELFNGALHIPRSDPGNHSWPFEIDIPNHPNHSSLKAHPFGKASYLPLSSAIQHALPPSFDLADSTTSGSSHDIAVVEYYLEATMATREASKHAGAIARLPIQLRCEASPFPITDFDVKIHSRQFYTVTSPRLAPAAETLKLSKRQQIASVLGVSSAPRLTFCLETNIPSVLQRGSPYPIPFELRAIPQWADTSKSIENLPQNIRINSFVLALHTTSSIIAFASGAVGGGESVRENHIKRKTVLAEYTGSSPKKTKQPEGNDEAQSEDQLGATLPDKCSSSPAYSSPLTLRADDSVKALDLGQVLDVKLQDGQFHVDEVPTFVTYNVKRTYELKWKMALEVGGKILSVKGRNPVLIMEEASGD